MKNELITIQKAKDIISKQAEELAMEKEKTQLLEKEIQYLKEKLDYLIRQKFTSKSEKFTNQPNLFGDNEEVVIEEDTEVVTYSRKKGGRKKPSKDLPRVRVEHTIPEAEQICSCGCQMHIIKELISEQYDIVPARFQIIENVRYVYGCRCGAKPKTTPVPPMIIPRSQVTASFLATVAVQKFEDASPLYRQAKIFKNRL